MKRVALAAGGVVVAVVVVMVVAGRSAESSSPARQRATAAAASAESPAASKSVDPMAGLTRDAAGATAAGVRVTELAETAMSLSLRDAVALQRQIASIAGADALVERLRAGRRDLARLGARRTMRFWVAPLATRLESIDAGRAEVSVWYVGVFQVPGLRTTQQWRTVTYRLVWERDSWRTDDEVGVNGPEPQRLYGAVPAGVDELDTHLARFTTLGFAP